MSDEQAESASVENMKFRAGDLEAQAAGLPAANMTVTLLQSRLPSTLDEYRTRIEKDLEAAGVMLLDASTYESVASPVPH